MGWIGDFCDTLDTTPLTSLVELIVNFYVYGKGSVIRINSGVVQHCLLRKSSNTLRLCMPGMLGKSYRHKKIRSQQPLLNLSKKNIRLSFREAIS